MLPNFGPGYAAADRTGKDARAMFAAAGGGELSALSIFGANPVRNAPGGGALATALAKIPFLVVSDLFLTETASLASLVLPAKGALEKSGTILNLAGDLLPIETALEAPDGVLSDFDMIAGLAERFDVALPGSEFLDAAVVANAALIPDAIAFGDERFASGETATEEAPPAAILSGGGTWRYDPTLAALRDGAAASQAVGAPA